MQVFAPKKLIPKSHKLNHYKNDFLLQYLIEHFFTVSFFDVSIREQRTERGKLRFFVSGPDSQIFLAGYFRAVKIVESSFNLNNLLLNKYPISMFDLRR